MTLGEGRRLTGFLRRHHSWFALVLYGALALVTQYQVLGHFSGGCACEGSDPTGFMWSMEWWPHALLHGLNPFHTSLMWVPDTTNLASTTTTPLPALLAAPLTWLAGPVVSYNVWVLLAPVIGAICAERLCFHLSRAAIPSIIGGCVYGFSAYETGQIQGHLNLVFTFALPLLLLFSLRWWDGTLSSRRLVVYGAIVLIAQLLSGTEMLATTTLMLVIIGVSVIVFMPATRARLIPLGRRLLCAYALCVAICSPFLYEALTGPKLGVGLSTVSGADLGSFVVPTTNMALGGSQFASTSARFLAGTIETGTYLGLPLLVICVVFAGGWRRSALVRVTVAASALTALWSLGGHLEVFGHQLIPLPWDLIGRLPLLDQLLPVRVGAYLSLGAAVALACSLGNTSRTRAPRSLSARSMLRVGRWALAVLTLVSLFPNISGTNFGVQYEIPPFFTHAYTRYVRPNEVLLTIPYTISPLWQATTHMYYRTAGGSFSPPNDYARSLAVSQLEGVKPLSVATVEPSLKALLSERHVSAVVVQADAAGQWVQVLAGLGLHAVDTDGVLFYQLSSR